MIDTHTHIYFPDYKEGISEIIRECQKSGVSHLILPNVDEESLPRMKELHEAFPGYTSMAIGIHPTEVKEDWQSQMVLVESELETGSYKAIGEVGIDLYWDTSTLELQKSAFAHQLKLAKKYNYPVIIHCREGIEETLEVIEKEKPSVPLIFHSFTGGVNDVERIRKVCDPWFGINGVVTFKNAPKLREALSEIGLDKILLETDSPYLAPVPHRGKPNNSSYLVHIRDKIAECLNVSEKKVEDVTDRNAHTIFRI